MKTRNLYTAALLLAVVVVFGLSIAAADTATTYCNDTKIECNEFSKWEYVSAPLDIPFVGICTRGCCAGQPGIIGVGPAVN